MPSDPRPIGVFDSGVGGLTVMRELVRQLPGESIVYFGDTARVPYGPKSAETVQRYSREAAHYLLSRDVKLLVVACNTATARAGELLADELPVPVVGVVEPGARAAVQATRKGLIGVIGTTGTIASGAYDLAVRRQLADVRVYAQPCPLFVPLVEEGWAEHPVAETVAAEYLQPLMEMNIDVLILGCTHYPVLQPTLQRILGPGIRMVDSARETAHSVRRALEREGLLRNEDAPPTYSFACSDLPLRFREAGRRIAGEIVGAVEQVSVEEFAARA